MTLAELSKLLKAGEWNDIEFKEARTDVPKSAFANTHGGRLVFGVAHHGDAFEIAGVKKLDKEVDMASDLVKAMFGAKPPTQSPTQSGDPVRRLLEVLRQGEMASGKLREALGIKHRPTFRDNYLHPAVEAGFIEYTIPDKPNSRLQKYRITDKGREALTKTESKVQHDDR